VTDLQGGGWQSAPCGLLTLLTDGTILDVNQTLLEWTGRTREETVGSVRMAELLSVGGRIYWETHVSPLLHVDGKVEEIAVELRARDGRMPVLMTAVLARSDDLSTDVVRVAVSGARDRSRYERELVAARTAAELSESRLRTLQQMTAALSSAIGVAGVGSAVLGAAARGLGARAATLWLCEDGDLEIHSGFGEDTATTPVPPKRELELRNAFADRGRVAVALRGQRELHGVLSLVPSTDAAADPIDLEVVSAVGQQVGLALDRARLYEQSASVSSQLQRSLLAAAPPADPRYDVATAYRPGVEMLEVGGDWYDVFRTGPDGLAVVVGDVVGRGLVAASAMGQLRSAVRALSGPDTAPGALLSGLDRFVEQAETASMATLVYAALSLDTGRVRYACAGHPPPVLLPARGEPRLLWDGRSTPLGIVVGPDARGDAEVQLTPGDRLLLYTDGLVERRDRSLDVSLEVLVDAVAGVRTDLLDTAVGSLTKTMLLDESTRDDVCVLLLSWSGPTVG
jgi:serine phosphatase RsbU (regulator of sigma subunit)